MVRRGGTRSSQDVLKAMAHGAKGTSIGRAFVYGLGAMGESGLRIALEIVASELGATMGFCGVVDIGAADPAVLMLRR
jgi:L-lactate dehydrogenase (cytochrome)